MSVYEFPGTPEQSRALQITALAAALRGSNLNGPVETFGTMPLEVKMYIVELLLSPHERMKGLSIIRQVNKELRHIADTILFARLALGSMSLHQVEHHLALLEDPSSNRLRNYTTTVSLQLVASLKGRWEREVDESMAKQKDKATASILKLLTSLSQIEIDFPLHIPAQLRDTWGLWSETIDVLADIGSVQEGSDRPFIRALELHSIKPSVDDGTSRIIRAMAPSLSALVLATESSYVYKSTSMDFGLTWSAITRHAQSLTTLVISGVNITPTLDWACAETLTVLDITSAPGLSPDAAYNLICCFPNLRRVTLRSIRLRLGSILPPSSSQATTPGTPLSPCDANTSSGLQAVATTVPLSQPTMAPPKQPISLQKLNLASVDITFVSSLTYLGAASLHLQSIHRSSTLPHVLQSPNAFVGLRRLIVGNEDGMEFTQVKGAYGWLGSKETEELKKVCQERGLAYDDERFSGWSKFSNV